MTKPISPAMPPRTSTSLLSVMEVAQRLGVSAKTVRRLIDNKAIVIHRIGRQIRVSEADLAAYTLCQRLS